MKEIFGFKELEQELLNSFHQNKLHHCNMMVGVDGIGKTSLAFNIASHILATGAEIVVMPSKLEETYRLVMNGSHPDFLLLDINSLDEDNKENTSKKGEISVSQTRRVMGELRLTPSMAKHKVLIINSIDRLNINAQNALLKTLEEPPNNSYIFLIANGLDGVLPTIRSRSNSIFMQKLSIEDWGRALVAVEDVVLEDEELEQLYELSNGSVAFALEVIKNDALGLGNRLLELVVSKDLVELQSFASDLENNQELYEIFKVVLLDLLGKLASGYTVKSGGATADLLDELKSKNSLNDFLDAYDRSNNIFSDIDNYALSKKHCITVLLNKLFNC